MSNLPSLFEQVTRPIPKEAVDALRCVETQSIVPLDDAVSIETTSVRVGKTRVVMEGTLHDPEEDPDRTGLDRYTVRASVETHGRVRRVLGRIFGNPIESAEGNITYAIYNSTRRKRLEEIAKADHLGEPVQTVRRI